MNKKKILLLLRNFILWVLAFLSFPLWMTAMHFAWENAPLFYSLKCVTLFFFCHVSFLLIQKKHYIYFTLFILSTYLFFYYWPFLFATIPALHEMADRYEIWEQAQHVSRNSFRLIYNFSILFIILYHLIWLRKEHQETLEEKLKSELMMLKSQIGPHFLFNSLNSIYSLALIKSEKTPDAIIALSNMMRYVLRGADREWVSIQETINYLDRYVELEKLRLPKKTTLEYEENVQGNYVIPPLLLIVFYENAFKYGISSLHPAKIIIKIWVENDTLHLYTCNSIIHSNKFKTSTGRGLANARRRLALIFPERHQLQIIEDDKLFKLKLTINLHPIHE